MRNPTLSRRRFGAAALAAVATGALGSPVAAASLSRRPRAADSYRVPAEWEPHAGTVMAWPWDRSIGWSSQLEEAQAEIATLARHIARFERVVMVAEPGTDADARQQCGSGVEVIEYPINDCWTRDTGPVFAVNTTGTSRIGLDFRFNGWGEKFPYAKDDLLPTGVCDHLGIARRPVDLVFEGGSVIQDGQGTLITTEECLLNPNRNPGMSKAEIESALLAAYGAKKLIWLPYGLDGDWITDGHVDLCTAYVGPAKLLILTQPGTGSPNESRMAANKDVLRNSTDALGRRFELAEIHDQPRFSFAGRQVEVFSYTNFYPVNGAVIVPLAGVAADDRALGLVRDLFPGREVIGSPARVLAWNGGELHCVTQQIPGLR